MKLRLACLSVVLTLTTACASQAVAPPPTAEANMPLAVAVHTPRDYAADGLDATAWVQRSIAHDAVFLETYRTAADQLLRALADPDWRALVPEERSDSAAKAPPAVILDIDETVLDNSPYQARLIRSGQHFDPETWARWVREETARALPGALEFTRFAASHGVRVFYISNREQTLDEATLANLEKAGFPVFGRQAFLGLGIEIPGCKQVGHAKTCRRQWVGRDYRVLALIGDQIGDFMTLQARTPAARKRAVGAYIDWFGQRWFMLPNPTYGSWKSALHRDQSHTPAQRHQDVVDALRVQ